MFDLDLSSFDLDLSSFDLLAYKVTRLPAGLKGRPLSKTAAIRHEQVEEALKFRRFFIVPLTLGPSRAAFLKTR